MELARIYYQRNSTWNASYTFSGKEKDVETGYSYFGARYYDCDLSIWLSVDPMSDKYPSMSPYTYCANNPVILVDPDGEKIEGVSKISALRIRNEILNSFPGEECAALRNLFQLDGNQMKTIDENVFNEAINGLNDDQKALANAYKETINSPETHYVDMTMSYETLNPITTGALGLPADTKGSFIEQAGGGGGNMPYGFGSLTVIVMDSKENVKDFVLARTGNYYSRKSTSAELLAHELLGHGYGRSHGRSEAQHYKDAIQMSNLYWRARGYNNFYRDGAQHRYGSYGSVNSQEIPTHFRR